MTKAQVVAFKVKALVEQNGSDIALEDGTTEKALIMNNERSFDLSLFQDVNPEVMKATVFFFKGTAFGKVRQGMWMKITDSVTGSSQDYRADGPLHPQFMQNQCVYLAVPAIKT